MAGHFTIDFKRIADWALPRTGAALCAGMRAIGWERDGQIVAGFLFEGFDGRNVWAHAAIASPQDCTRTLLRAMLHYVFGELGCVRLWARMCADNAPCIRFVERLGARRVAVLPQADGDRDVLIYRLDRQDVRAAYFDLLGSTANG
jgi:RimJ/RimL family protein N-acetyltransferase